MYLDCKSLSIITNDLRKTIVFQLPALNAWCLSLTNQLSVGELDMDDLIKGDLN